MPHTRMESKWIKDLNVRLKMTTILEEKTGSRPSDIYLYISSSKGNKRKK